MNKPTLLIYPNYEQIKKYKSFFRRRELKSTKYYEMGHGFYGLAKFLTILNNMEMSMSRITRYISENFSVGIANNLEDILHDINKIKHIIGF